MGRDYYDVLDLDRSAPRSEIREAYRTQVKQVHPDVNDHPDAGEQFKHLKEAHQVLSQRKSREEYDQSGHGKYVQKNGGYSSEELSDISEPDIVPVDPGQEIDLIRGEDIYEPSESSEIGPSIPDQLEWIIQGRTSEMPGNGAYLLRLVFFISVTYLSLALLSSVTNQQISELHPLVLLGILSILRVGYLTAFERLREKYIKIDSNPEPDAFAVPYSLLLAFVGVFPLSSGILLTRHVEGMSVLLTIVLAAVGLGIFGAGYIGIILSVGWGVADDHYNLKYRNNPVLWNFSVQFPGILAIVLLFSGIEPILAILVAITTFPVGIAYLTRYHPDAWYESYKRLEGITEI